MTVNDAEQPDERRTQPSPDGMGTEPVVVDRPPRETTGDEGVDAVLEQFDQVTGDLDAHVDGARSAHQALQARLSNPVDG